MVGAAVLVSAVVGEEEVDVVGFPEVETVSAVSVVGASTASCVESALQAARETMNTVASMCPAGRRGMAAT